MSLGLGAQAYERRYMAAMEDSEWTLTDDSAILCRAEHPIPRFGKAIFSQEAGRGLRLELISRLAFKRGNQCRAAQQDNQLERPRDPRRAGPI